MKKRFPATLLALLLLIGLSGCGPSKAPAADDGSIHVLATTYPVYLFTSAVTKGVEGVDVSLLVNQQTSCLHDYTLTTNDMKAIETADVIVKSGAGLEAFMDDALQQTKATVVDCSSGIDLLTLDEGGVPEDDPHLWMDPGRAAQMVENIGAGLISADPDHTDAYRDNAGDASFSLTNFKSGLRNIIASDQPDLQLAHRELITFHDGFQYFADAFDLTILKSIEEEEGSEASASDIKEIVALIGEHSVPAIFTERNGSTATADAIARETGCQVAQLDLLMSGGTDLGDDPLAPYTDALTGNVKAVVNALGGGTMTME